MAQHSRHLQRVQFIMSTPTVENHGLCNYSRHVCTRNRLEGHLYCSRHILEEKPNRYRQCAYVSNKTGRQCSEAVLKLDSRDGFCATHVRKFLTGHQTKKPLPQQDAAQNLLSEIEQHLCSTLKSTGSRLSDNVSATDTVYDSSESEDESIANMVNMESTYFDDVDSDAESIDSEQENALKHAGVYTAEEVAYIFRDKLIRLQLLYIDQFKMLHRRLHEKRRQYLRTVSALPAGHDTGNGNALENKSVDDVKKSRLAREKLSALRRYHRRFGKEALLTRQLTQRRMLAYEGDAYKPPSFDLCQHNVDGISCASRAVPLSNYCFKHIFEDSKQVLYTSCTFDNSCRQPVSVISSDARCWLHQQLTPFVCRYNGRRDYADIKEETVDVVTVTNTTEGTMETALPDIAAIEFSQQKETGTAGAASLTEKTTSV